MGAALSAVRAPRRTAPDSLSVNISFAWSTLSRPLDVSRVAVGLYTAPYTINTPSQTAPSPCSLLALEKSSQEEVEQAAEGDGISKRKRGGAPPDKAPRHATTATARGEGCGGTAGPSPSLSSPPAAKSKPSPVPHRAARTGRYDRGAVCGGGVIG